MPLNQKKQYAFTPNSTGPIKLSTRNAKRSRLSEGGTFFRSVERGEQANAIKLGVVQDGFPEIITSGYALTGDEEIMFFEHHTVLVPEESIFFVNMSQPDISLFKLDLNWNEEVRIRKINGIVQADLYGIRWQIAPGVNTLLAALGPVRDGKLFSSGDISFKISGCASWPTNGVLYLRPRVHQYHLEVVSDTDVLTMDTTIGADIDELRTTLKESDTSWVKMPARAVKGPEPEIGLPPKAEDAMDDGVDDVFLSAFEPTNMKGGDGLPLTPAGLNTGPDRTLIHLNMVELDDGMMGEFNRVFEWVGTTSAVGSWQFYG